MHHCLYCGESCPEDCLPGHQWLYICHNGDCPGQDPEPCVCETFPDVLLRADGPEGESGYRCQVCDSFCKAECFLAHVAEFHCHDGSCTRHLPVVCTCKASGAADAANISAAVEDWPNFPNSPTSSSSSDESPYCQPPRTVNYLSGRRTSTKVIKKEDSSSDDEKMSCQPQAAQKGKNVQCASEDTSSEASTEPTASDASTADDSNQPVEWPYNWVVTIFGQRSIDRIPGDAMQNNFLGTTLWVPEHVDQEPSMKMIVEGLYIGTTACVESDEFIVTHGITSVITARFEPLTVDKDHPLLALIPIVNRVFVRARDNTVQDMMKYFPGVNEFIDERLRPYLFDQGDNGQASQDIHARSATKTATKKKRKQPRILIHCSGNKSRSATLAVAYVMYRYKINEVEALKLVERRTGWLLWPNPEFMRQLRMWGKLKYKLYRNHKFKIPCDEYEEYRFHLSKQRVIQAFGKPE